MIKAKEELKENTQNAKDEFIASLPEDNREISKKNFDEILKHQDYDKYITVYNEDKNKKDIKETILHSLMQGIL